MRVGEIRIYRSGKLQEICEQLPIREAELSAHAYADMISGDTRQPIRANSNRDLSVGEFRVRVVKAGNY